MTWSTKQPTKEGWYLVTVKSLYGDKYIVMPDQLIEYPKNYFHWGCNANVIAWQIFPKPYSKKGETK